MNQKLLEELLGNAPKTKIAVIGDYCLDKYLYIDSSLDEPSVETGLTAYQVKSKKMYAGAAGTVAHNLRSLGAEVRCIGVIGHDGEGFELVRALDNMGADTTDMIIDANRCTPSYYKPMRSGESGYAETNRLDFKNYERMKSRTEEELLTYIYDAAETSDALIVLDQYLEPDCGVINSSVREVICDLALKKPELVVYADSRAFIHRFHNVILKCNNFETVRAVIPDYPVEPDEKTVTECGKKLYEKNGRAVFVTQGSRGMTVIDDKVFRAQGIQLDGPLDICGAGDSASAGIVLALAQGASAADAAILGNLVASVTVQQIGVTGCATPKQVIGRYKEISL